jgi:hypothetical protein
VELHLGSPIRVYGLHTDDFTFGINIDLMNADVAVKFLGFTCATYCVRVIRITRIEPSDTGDSVKCCAFMNLYFSRYDLYAV